MRPSLAHAAFEALESRRLLSAGDLDLSYGTGGKTTVGYVGPADDFANAVVVLPDGKILVGGDSFAGDNLAVLSRYLANGQLDTTFGTGGRVRPSTVPWGSGVQKIVLNADGTFLGLGNTNPSIGLQPVLRFTANGALDATWVGPGTGIGGSSRDLIALGAGQSLLVTTNTLAKLNTNGTLDTATFGAGTGKVVFAQEPNFIQFTPVAAAVQADGKIIVAGERRNISTGAREPAVRRFNADGTPDSGFGTGGQQLFLLPAGSTAPALRAIAVQPSDQRIVVAGTNGGDSLVARLLTTGAADQSFGPNGIRIIAESTTNADSFVSIAIQSDGKLVLSGTDQGNDTTTPRPFLARVLSTGLLDTGYALGDGIHESLLPAGWYGGASQVALNATGNAMLVGAAWTSTHETEDFLVARVTTAGRNDPTFDGDGVVATDFEAPHVLFPARASVGPSGQVVIGGSVRLTAGGVVIAQVLPNGTPDASFGTGNGDNGVRDYDFGGRSHLIWDTAVQPDGKIVAVGRVDYFDFGTSWTYDALVARFNPNGTLDLTFGGGDGYVLADLSDDFEQFLGVVVQDDGKILTHGIYEPNGGLESGPIMWRLLPDGTPDLEFGLGNGFAPPLIPSGSSISEMRVTPDGKIFLAGMTGFEIDRFVQRLNENGSPDAAFGDDSLPYEGTVLLDAGADPESLIGLSIHPITGEILVAGTIEMSSISRFDVTLTKLDEHGAIVTAYGAGGYELFTYEFNSFVWTPDNKILLGGTRRTGNRDLAVTRLLDNGTTDPTFGGGAIVTVDFGGLFDSSAGMFLRPDGSIIVVSQSNVSSTALATTRWGVARLQGDAPGMISGGVFHDFDGDGAVDPGEFPHAGLTVYVDLDDDGVRDLVEPSAVTNANGSYSIFMPPGTYHVRAAEEGGWLSTSTETAVVQSGQLTSLPALGARYNYASIFGHVFIDTNGNGVKDTGEGAAQEQTIYIDANDNGVRDQGEQRALTDSSGNYRFDGMAAGTRTIRLQPFTNWVQTLPASNAARVVTVSLGDQSGPHTFGTRDTAGSISGVIWNDQDADGVRDAGEPGISGRIAFIDLNGSGTLDLTSEPIDSTDANGNFTLTNLPAGAYSLYQQLPSGWRQTVPAAGAAISVNLAQLEHETGHSFGSTSVPVNGYIAGFIYDDVDADGVRDAGETTYLGRTIWLDTDNDGVLDAGERSTTSPSGDSFIFFDVPPGTYNVRASVPTGWRQTSPANNAAYVYSVSPGQTGAIFIGQTRQVGWIDGTVFYDADGSGVNDAGDRPAQGHSVYLDLNANGTFESGDPVAITDAVGHYQFPALPGTWTVRLLQQPGVVQTLPASGGRTVTVVANQAVNASAFGMYLAIQLNGNVFTDANGNGTRDTGEAAISGRRIYVDRNGSNTFEAGEFSATSDASGNYAMNIPANAVHFVRQELPAGWAHTAPANTQIVVGGVPVTVNFGSRLNPQQPYNGSPFVVGDTPITIEAEHYDKGGEGVAYHDTDASNGGGAIRTTEGVDLKLVSASNYRVNNTFAGEWFEYTINVTKGDDYHLEYRVSSLGSNGSFYVESYDPISGSWTNDIGGGVIPNTGSHTNWVTLKHTKYLPAGLHVYRFTIGQNSTYGSAGNFDWFRITNANTQEPPPPTGNTVTLDTTTAAYVRNGTYATQNFGNDAQLIAKTSANAGNTRESYLKFDVSTLPSDPDAITNVKLRVYGKKSASGTNPTIGVFGASNTSWAEGTLTWNSKPATSGGALASKSLSSTSDAWHEFDITNYVKQARQNGQSLVTLVLRATNTTDPQAVFNSDEAASNKPQLVATTTGPITPPPPQQGLVVSHADSGAGVPEDGFEPVAVTLAIAPTSNVTVTITKQGGGDADITADKATLTFTPANWNVPQLVNLSGANDADTTNGTATFSFASSGLPTINVLATEQDDDTPPPTGGTITTDTASYVRGGAYAAQNFGAASELIVKKANSADSTREAYIKFDLSSLSAIGSAKLRLNARLSDTSNASLVTQVFSVTNTSWTEGGLTWNNKPASGTTVHGSVTVSGTTAQWYEIDLTNFLKAEFAAGRKVVTLVLKNTIASNAQTVIGSDESANGPQLLIT